jgi:hypothetical protein
VRTDALAETVAAPQSRRRSRCSRRILVDPADRTLFDLEVRARLSGHHLRLSSRLIRMYFEAFSTEFKQFSASLAVSQNEFGLAPLSIFGHGEHVSEGFRRNVHGTAERVALAC